MKSDFINNMTHEFKTPIATINLAIDAIKKKLIGKVDNKSLSYLNIIKDENNRMNNQKKKDSTDPYCLRLIFLAINI